ncbi:MAG: hypothetical protein ACREMJ_00870 [Gemmatimonadales bacterium]
MLTLTLDATTVCSPDTLTGRARAQDPDGIDSVWVTLDGQEWRLDGRLERAFEHALTLPVPPGLAEGTAVAVALRARDLAGMSDTVQHDVVVIPCTATT